PTTCPALLMALAALSPPRPLRSVGLPPFQITAVCGEEKLSKETPTTFPALLMELVKPYPAPVRSAGVPSFQIVGRTSGAALKLFPTAWLLSLMALAWLRKVGPPIGVDPVGPRFMS